MTNQRHTHRQDQPQRRTVDFRIPAIEKYAYCLCLHVKPTTIFIAVFKMIPALMSASMLLNIEFATDQQLIDHNLMAVEERHKSATIAISILNRILMASVSAVAIYAVLSGRAALLMPFYAILLVDFFSSLPSFYNRDLEHSSMSDSLSDFKNYNNTNQYPRYSILLFSALSVIVKVYFLCVIWKCYRYLRLIELVSPLRLPDIYPNIRHSPDSQYPIVRVLTSSDPNDLATGHNVAPPPYESIASSMKPPNYEEAIKTPNIVIPIDSSGSNEIQRQHQIAILEDPVNSNQRQNVSTQILQNNDDINSSSTVVSMIPTNSHAKLTSSPVCVISSSDMGSSQAPETTVITSATNDNPIVGSNATWHGRP